MDSKKVITKSPFRIPLICYVCGDIARGMNFDVVTCMSCKAFFRRHALRSPNILRCQLNNNCNITKLTRSGCSCCRLKKCFALGMNSDLIRSPYRTQQTKTIKKETQWLLRPTPLGLLNHDRSTLTFDEWNLLSNIIHAYDEQNLIIRTQCSLKERSSLPLKIRSKKTSTLDLIGSYYTAIQPFIERSSYFHHLPADIRRIIIQNNLNGTGSFNSVLAAAEANVFDNEDHVAVCNEIYGTEYVKESARVTKRMESNRTLLKIMLMILAFSGNSSIVIYGQSINLINPFGINSIDLSRIQDVLITMLWKYLIYQYGFIGAVKRLDYIVKNYLDVLNRTNANISTQHWQMVDIIVEKTTHSLALNT